MANWNFTPQQVLADDLTSTARVTGTNLTDVAGRTTSDLTRSFRLQYSIVSSADAYAMHQFYTDRKGPWEAFTWLHPVDGRVFVVRFASPLNSEMFFVDLVRFGGEIVLTVVTS